MSKNIKEVTKELTGGGLNVYHRKTGLESLEKNNEMQDGILNGMLSQIDDAYISKTEESNVIHLDGSGDGVVVLDSIEGNTMVNLIPKKELKITCNTDWDMYFAIGRPNETLNVNFGNVIQDVKPNTIYTLVYNVIKRPTSGYYCINNPSTSTVFDITVRVPFDGDLGVNKVKLTTVSDFTNKKIVLRQQNSQSRGDIHIKDYMLIEGDWTNKEIPSNIEGMQSSFEEKKVEDKYEIEILSQNSGNLFDGKTENGRFAWISGDNFNNDNPHTSKRTIGFIEVIEGAVLYTNQSTIRFLYDKNKKYLGNEELGNMSTSSPHSRPFVIPKGVRYIRCYWGVNDNLTNCYLGYSSKMNYALVPKSNKIKLLVNEPLRGIGSIKDRLCVVDGKLMVERKYCGVVANDTKNWSTKDSKIETHTFQLRLEQDGKLIYNTNGLTDAFIWGGAWNDYEHIWINEHRLLTLHISKSKIGSNTNELKQWLKSNPITVIYELAEPTYEEVLNEYGEPILLEGYENGTLYIDSVIVPTTSVRYTPKNQSKIAIENNRSNIVKSTLFKDNNTALVLRMLDIESKLYELEKKNGIIVNEEKRTKDNYKLLVNNILVDTKVNNLNITESCFNINNRTEFDLAKLIKNLSIKNELNKKNIK